MGSGKGGDSKSVHSPEQRAAQAELFKFLAPYIGEQMATYPGARVAGYSPTQSMLYEAFRGGGGQGDGSVPVQSFQTGGVVTKPTVGLLGEKGPEAVVPLGGKTGGGGKVPGGKGTPVPALGPAPTAAPQQQGFANWDAQTRRPTYGGWRNPQQQQQQPAPAPTPGPAPTVVPQEQITGGAPGPWDAQPTGANPLSPIFGNYFNALQGMLGPGTDAAQNYFQTSYVDPMMQKWRTEMLPGLMQSQAGAGTIGTGAAQQAREDMSGDIMRQLGEVGAGLQYQQQQLALPQVLGLGEYARGLGQDERAMQQQTLDAQYQQWLQSLDYNHPALQMLMSGAFNQTYVPTQGGGKGKL